MSTTLKKILVIDDHILFREGLMSLLRSVKDFEVVGGAGSVHEGIEMTYQFQPDMILMDFSMPDGTGLDATHAILAKFPDTQIVFLTMHEADEKLFAALRAGAKGYLLKDTPSKELIGHLCALASGDIAISRQMAGRVIREFSRIPASTPHDDLLSKLSTREMDVLRELGSEATNREIAQKLFLSENTVKHHMRNLLVKLGVENRRQASLIAKQCSLKSNNETGESS